jgi:hypothetical protein
VSKTRNQLDMIPQQALIVESNDLRDIPPLRGHGCLGLLLRHSEGRAEEHREQAQYPSLHLVPPCLYDR